VAKAKFQVTMVANGPRMPRAVYELHKVVKTHTRGVARDAFFGFCCLSRCLLRLYRPDPRFLTGEGVIGRVVNVKLFTIVLR